MNEKSNKLSDVIARLQELEKEYGGDIRVIADTLDDATYDVTVGSINVEDYNSADNKQIKVVHIE